MRVPPVTDHVLTELGSTGGGPDALALLARDQDTRRLLLLRAVLDAVDEADEALCPAALRSRLLDDWALLVAADAPPPKRAEPTAQRTGAPSPARERLLHPLVGPWAQSCLSALDRRTTAAGAHRLRRDLAHFSALAAAAAARADLSFTVRLTAHDGVLDLPSIGTLRIPHATDRELEVRNAEGRLTVRQHDAADVTVHPERGTGGWSGAAGWTSAYALPALTPAAAPVPLDDLGPYRAGPGGSGYPGLGGPGEPGDAERKQWLQAWSGTSVELRLGGDQRLLEAATLLRGLVPLTSPDDSGSDDTMGGTCSGTRPEAFGAVLSTAPPAPDVFAVTLVHELQHTKLVALSQLVTLHQAGPDRRYFAPWRTGPRQFDGLFQGTYSHLALADFFQQRALTAAHHPDREAAWSAHARCREQVAAALPVLAGSPDLTVPGRRFVDEMIGRYERMAQHRPPRHHVVRAQAYVAAARALFEVRRTRPTG
ncbi:hypothetical protein DSC45_15580 [Streptomyces sp. YIM 130001]|uniref:aKG-HExxH-type peptide beta-hydroxylase n=1 Tax=Streptomyces sp. YIM 130001 TaxID=2259644 RepID=UPI000E65B566|nr:HEXXH motif-containing putative peptide modification protein [Streptomyces sp. YIM 130001]RII16007.1 hypothetical protein DSC45_15580 [Streptomyces sp. YIM 130001]